MARLTPSDPRKQVLSDHAKRRNTMQKPPPPTDTERRFLRFYLQRLASASLPDERVRWCCKRHLDNDAGVRVLRRAGKRARYTNVMRCESIWTCPVCALQRALQRRAEITALIAAMAADGYTAVLCTRTLSHRLSEPLSVVLGAVKECLRYSRSGRAYQVTVDRWCIAGTITATEITRSYSGGWHPHVHEIIFVGTDVLAESDIALLELELWTQWNSALIASGRSATKERGLKVSGNHDAVGAYASKWGISDEISQSTVKRSRKGSITPWDLLYGGMHLGLKSDLDYWYEYVAATKGREQLVVSRSLSERLKTIKETIKAERGDDETEGVYLATLSLEEYRRVYLSDHRAMVLAICEGENPEAALRLYLTQNGLAD